MKKQFDCIEATLKTYGQAAYPPERALFYPGKRRYDRGLVPIAQIIRAGRGKVMILP